MDTNWYHAYNGLQALNDSLNYGQTATPDWPLFAWDVLEIDYPAFPNGGIMKLATNAVYSGTMVDTGFTINSSNNTLTGRSAFWTNPAGAHSMSFSLIQTSASGSN